MDESETTDSRWKEAGSAVIALAVVVVTLTLLYQTFHAAADTQGKKDVLLIAVSLLGTVTGYYFGRVPSELRAQAAETASRKAEQREQHSRSIARQSVDSALDALRLAGGRRVAGARLASGRGHETGVAARRSVNGARGHFPQERCMKRSEKGFEKRAVLLFWGMFIGAIPGVRAVRCPRADIA